MNNLHNGRSHVHGHCSQVSIIKEMEIADQVKKVIYSVFLQAAWNDKMRGFCQLSNLVAILQYIQSILHGLTNALLCVPFIFPDSQMCGFGDCT